MKKIVSLSLPIALALSMLVASPAYAFSSGSSSLSSGLENPATKPGSRQNPLPIGSTIKDGDWKVRVNSVNLDANAEVAAGNMFNPPAPEGYSYVLVNVTVQYNGKNPQGDTPLWLTFDYVTADGISFDTYNVGAVIPNELDKFSTLYEGATVTGNVGFRVPVADIDQGTLAISANLFSDNVFVSVK